MGLAKARTCKENVHQKEYRVLGAPASRGKEEEEKNIYIA
jgi:hypothetical protein